MKDMYAKLGITAQVYDFGEKILAELKDRFEGIDRIAELNQAKVLHALQL